MINTLSTTACVVAMLSNYLLARGRLKAVYCLSIVNGVIFIALNLSIALSGADQFGMAMLVVPSAWMVVTALLGLRRLHREKQRRASAALETG
ncbi:MAG: hypothetical protein RIC55_20525 [Pirellulaceae bacterium]